MQRVFVIGGTGFLGYHAIQEFLAKGWGVTALGLPPAHPLDSSAASSGQTLYPAAVKLILQNLDTASDEELVALLRGHEAMVFAAGLDDRYTLKKPAYPRFYQANVESLRRLLILAKKAGVKRTVVLGSYFVHFNRQWPDLKLAERNPYIRSRLEQEKVTTSIHGLDGMVLELPYIFGAMPISGWKPLWAPLVKYIRFSKIIFYMKGGTACVSARTVGRAIVAAVERGEAGKVYPIGQENLTWRQMLTRLARADERTCRILTLPIWTIKLGMFGILLVHNLQGKEGFLNLRYFAQLQTAETFFDPQPSKEALGYQTCGLDEAFQEMVEACKS
ncbi:MAG TPA: NAD-dependent epimerase/dehydratase family protein [Anaerolineales bacterium]